MITRAQAEALLTLAESLEACERVGITFSPADQKVELFWGQRGVWSDLRSLGAENIRTTVAKLISKTE